MHGFYSVDNVKINILKTPKIILIIESIFLFSILIVSFSLNLAWQNELNTQINLQEIEDFSLKIEDFVQTGQVFINNYASKLKISESSDLLVLQLKNILIPFPFFSQLNLVDSNGTIIAGFPQNFIGQKYPLEPIYLSDTSNSSVKVFPKMKGSSLFSFIMALPQNNSVYIIGESDLQANPLNAGFSRVLLDLMQKGIKVKFSDSQGNEFLHFENSSVISEQPNSIQMIQKEFVLQKWVFTFSFPKKVKFIDVLTFSSPLILLGFLFEGLLIFQYLKNIRNHSSSFELKENFNEQKFDNNDQLENFKRKLLDISSLDEVGKLVLSHADLKDESSIRLVFLDNPYNLNKGINTTFSSGRHSNNFNYLDDQINELLKNNSEVNIPDLHDYQNIHLLQDRPFPIAIYALPIKSGKTIYGFIWYGFEKPRVLRESEKRYLRDLIEAGKKVIITLLKYNVYKEVSVTQNLILEAFPHPVLLINSQNIILYFNQSFENYFGLEEDLAGKRIQDLQKFSFPQELSDSKENGTYQFNDSSGATFKAYLIFMEDNAGQKNKIIIFENISHQEEHTKNLNEMTELISHDLRVPLATIKGYLSMLPVMGQVNQQQLNYIDSGIHQIDELTDLIKNLFIKERLNKKEGIIQDNISINGLLDEIVFSLKLLADQKKIEIINDYRESPDLKISKDKWLIKIAIKNILENAIRFTPNKGKVIIRKEKVQDNVEISIEDTGIGIAAVDLPHIFEKSYQLKIKSDLGESRSGQSLAIVKSIIEKQDGEIGVVSELGKGSTFFISLPISND